MSVIKSKIRACLYYEYKRNYGTAEIAQRVNDVFGVNICSHESVKKWL